ncbi:MAG TPA: SsrA-binding protein SmpB [Acidimicrobiales bacterium]|nr:SsrA-binding protein SmpB [Acidimicrobiales bacterium]
MPTKPGPSSRGHTSLRLEPGRLRAGPQSARPQPKKSKGATDPNNRRVAQNRRARHEYDILDTYECGMALRGPEVKALREGRVTLQDSYARVEGGEMWLLGAHFAPYEYATGFGRVDPDRARKLLLHREQIDELAGRVAQQSLTLVPLTLYFKDGKAKLELALARGRRLYDKRRALAERDANREAERVIREYQRR